ncbi:MAG: DUF4115 domain-containing protein [Sneathiella sp.]|nr:DUF4115 domain-containing protein [Sneathiella sp.]
MAKNDKQPGANKQPNLFSRNASLGNRLSFRNPEMNEGYEEDVPLTVGARLRATREAKGLSLHQVADILRLRAIQVQALEEGNYNQLPGQTFVTGFLRSYANLLDLDAVALVELYKHEHGDGVRVPSLAFPEPTTGGRMPGTGILLGTLVVALVMLAGWFLYQESESLDFERVAELPEHLANKIRDVTGDESAAVKSVDSLNDQDTGSEKSIAVAEAPIAEKPEVLEEKPSVAGIAPDETGQKQEAAVEPVISDDQAPQKAAPGLTEVAPKPASASVEQTANVETAPAPPAPVDTNVAENPSPSVDTSAKEKIEEVTSLYPQATLEKEVPAQGNTAQEEEPENPLPRTFGVENTNARVVLRAREESWVEVKSADDKPVLSRVLKPGDVYMAPNEPDLMLTTGNAGGLEIRVDGKEINALGGAGAILRDVPLVADSLLENNSVHQ